MKNKLPLFSIITITYNNAIGLTKTLESIRVQSEKNFEVIVIDGGSDDNSLDIIKEYADIITYSVSEKDRGISHAFNKGTQEAKGEILNYLNSGDTYLHKDVLSIVRDSYSKDKWKWAYGLRKRIDINGNIYNARAIELTKYKFNDFLFSKLIICHQATFIKKNILTEIGLYNEKYQFLAMDYDLLLRISEKYTPTVLNSYLILYEDFGVSSKHFLKNLKEKHNIRIDNMNLKKSDIVKSFLITYLSFISGKSRSFIKNILLKTSFGKKILLK